MKYRNFGKTGWGISELSIGVLRLEEALEAPDEKKRLERVEAIRFAIDRGVNYVNLGYPSYFRDRQKACEYVNEALDREYRSKVKVAVNLPVRGLITREDLDNALDSQMRLFNIEKADFCIIDNVRSDSRDILKSLDIASWASSVIDKGKIGYIGLGFHDDAHYLKDIIDICPQWEVIHIELSIPDYLHHPGVGALTFTQEQNIAVIATDITKAGRLTASSRKNVREVQSAAREKMSPEERCIRWALSFSGIASAQMSVQAEFNSVKQIEKYLSYTEGFAPQDVGIWEMLDAARLREAYFANRASPCKACYCCMPCPYGIDAPRIIELINDESMFPDTGIPEFQYNFENHQNKVCTECGSCNKLCLKRYQPQRIVLEAYERYANKRMNK